MDRSHASWIKQSFYNDLQAKLLEFMTLKKSFSQIKEIPSGIPPDFLQQCKEQSQAFRNSSLYISATVKMSWFNHTDDIS